MSKSEIPDDAMLTEAQFREVIDRATRAELRDPGVTIDVVRQVAAELNIDEHQLERALRVVLAPPDADRIPAPPLRGSAIGRALNDILPRRGRALVFAVIGAALGWFSAHIGNTLDTGAMGFVDVPIGIGLILLGLANSVNRRGDGRVRSFILESVATWTAFDIAWSVAHGRITGDVLTYFASSLIGASLWGWLFVRRGGPGAPSARSETAGPASKPAHESLEEGPELWRSVAPQAG